VAPIHDLLLTVSAHAKAAASLAAALGLRHHLEGKRVLLIMTRGKLSLTNLRRALELQT